MIKPNLSLLLLPLDILCIIIGWLAYYKAAIEQATAKLVISSLFLIQGIQSCS